MILDEPINYFYRDSNGLCHDLTTGFQCDTGFVVADRSFSAMSTCHPSICRELQKMIDEAGRDGDGEVNEEEFLPVMKKTNLFSITSELRSFRR